MNVHRTHLIVLGIVTLWGIFSYMYLGVEDGSSGLSPLGWVHVVFIVPGVSVVRILKGTHSNTPYAVTVVISWVLFAAVALGMIHLTRLLRKV